MKHAECKIEKRAHFEHKIIAYKKSIGAQIGTDAFFVFYFNAFLAALRRFTSRLLMASARESFDIR